MSTDIDMQPLQSVGVKSAGGYVRGLSLPGEGWTAARKGESRRDESRRDESRE
jgi:hypothetical protein